MERTTSDQLVVVTLPSLEGRPIETWGLELGNGWGVGQDKLDNGVLLIVAPNDRKVRIEVGYGLEGLLTDARAKDIIDAQLLPSFRENDLVGGIQKGVDAIIKVLESSRARPMPKFEKVAA